MREVEVDEDELDVMLVMDEMDECDSWAGAGVLTEVPCAAAYDCEPCPEPPRVPRRRGLLGEQGRDRRP